jgi:hypothetical protein
MNTKININLVEIMNFAKWTREMQEYVIDKRPDLISKIEYLDPYLEKKYGNELGLSRIDV